MGTRLYCVPHVAVEDWSSVNADDDHRGLNYEPGLQIVPALTENQGSMDWRYDALCHEQYDVFDLAMNPNLTQDVDQQRENQYRTIAARRICHECPVFMQCHEDALEKLPVGVIQAGARLSSPFRKLRERALLLSLIRYQTYQMRKKRKRLDHG